MVVMIQLPRFVDRMKSLGSALRAFMQVWSISQGTCLRTLSGHFSQIYAIAFDGKRIATGSLDTFVRIWDPETG